MQLVLAGIIVLGALSHWLAWRLKLPAILFLLLVGLVAGPVAGVLDPDALYGESLFAFVSLAVAVILFEGSLTLRWSDLRGIGGAVWGLVTVGAAITAVLVTIAAHFLMQMPWSVSALVGAICSVTGPTVVVPILRAVRPTASVSNTLRWEGIIVDPIGAILAVLVAEFVRTRTIEALWLAIASLLGAGLACGLAAAFGLAWLLRRHLIPWYLRDVSTLAFVLASFAVANSIAHEAGLLAVTVMGMALANMKQISVADILDFKESLTLLLVAMLFITLAARLDFAEFASLSWGLPFFLVAVILVVRPVAVFASTALSRLTVKEKLLVSWVSPRGIVAAAVASLFALEFREMGIAGAEQLVPVVFSVIIATVVLQSATAGRVAGALGLSNPDPNGVLVLGASTGVRAFAAKLKERGFQVMLADVNWADVRRARMEGFDAYYGRIVTDHAEGHIDHGAIGYLFAMSPRRDENTLACVHFRPELGAHAVFAVRTNEERESHMREMTGAFRVEHLFGKSLTLGDLERIVADGGEFRMTRLTESFDFKAYRDAMAGEFFPLLGIDPRGRLIPYADSGHPTLKAGWQLMSLLPRATAHAEAARAAERAAASPGASPVTEGEPPAPTGGDGTGERGKGRE